MLFSVLVEKTKIKNFQYTITQANVFISMLC